MMEGLTEEQKAARLADFIESAEYKKHVDAVKKAKSKGLEEYIDQLKETAEYAPPKLLAKEGATKDSAVRLSEFLETKEYREHKSKLSREQENSGVSSSALLARFLKSKAKREI